MTPDSSGMTEFLEQISGLLGFTCAAGLIWLVLMALVVQRASERRRRAAQGEPPLPGFHVTALNWLRRVTASGGAAPRRDAPGRTPAAIAAPLPDLSMLTGDLPPDDAPPVEAEPEPAPAEPTPPVDEAPVQAPAEGVAEAPPPGEPLMQPPPDAVEVLRVWRAPDNGALFVALGEQVFTSAEAVRRAGLEPHLQGVLRDLARLAGTPLVPPPPRPVTPTIEPPPARPESLLRQVSRVAMGAAPVADEPVHPRGIADEIEDLLQARLRTMPEYANRSIHVKPALDGGVRIEVGDTSYAGVGDVDDPEIRALLLDVVREWEARE